jgi:REP element-mobilizing transposase RayT
MTIRSSRPLVIAHHLVWTAYGWWLPNDPRGSMSTWIASDVIADLGDLHLGRKKMQPCSATIRDFYNQAEARLKHELLLFDEKQRIAIASSFEQVVAEQRLTCYACAIMPDHVHMLLRKHRLRAEQMIQCFQRASAQDLHAAGYRAAEHPVWGGRGWKVFLESPDEVRRTIGYIRQNPTKMHMPAQPWVFVREYDGWPLHPGHSPNSPYARRLRE